MKITKYISYAFISGLLLSLASCNLEKFDDYNTDPYSVKEEN